MKEGKIRKNMFKKNNEAIEISILVKLLDGNNDSENMLGFSKLKPEYFQNIDNKRIYEIVFNQYLNGKPWDYMEILSLVSCEHDNTYLQLSDLVKDVYNPLFRITEDKLNELENCYHLTLTWQQTAKILKKYEREPDADIIKFKSELKDLLENASLKRSNGTSLSEMVDKYYYEDEKPTHFSTNIPMLDAYLGGGLGRGTLTTIAAEPGVGKTYFSMYLIDKILEANPDTQSLFFSLEMEKRKIYERFITLKAKKFKDKCTQQEYDNAAVKAKLTNVKVFDVKDEPECSYIEYIKAISILENKNKQISTILVDYLSIVQINKKFERDDLRISEIVRQLTNLSILLECSVILLVHTNRNAQNRRPYDRAPLPYDEAQSQASFRSSSIWIGIDKPSRHIPNDIRLHDLFVLRCAKNRNFTDFYISTKFLNGTYSEDYILYNPENYDQKTFNNIS